MRPSLNREGSASPLVPPPTVYEGADTCESVKIQKRWILDAPTGVFAAAVLLVAAIVFAYANSFSGVCLFDDDGFITENASIEHLATAFIPPPKATVSDRSLLNLSFAVNYALGGSNLWGYHLGNLLIHECSALAFLGIVRRMLLVPTFRERYGARGTGLALVIALLWALHPLQTGSFTYSIQQAESSMGMLYLLTLYLFLLFLRAMVSPRQDALAAAMTDVVFANYRLFGRKGLLVLGTRRRSRAARSPTTATKTTTARSDSGPILSENDRTTRGRTISSGTCTRPCRGSSLRRARVAPAMRWPISKLRCVSVLISSRRTG